MITLEDLQAKFGLAESIFFSRERGDIVCVNLKSDGGATAQLALYGGHLLSWRTPDGVERLFMSSQALFQNGKAIRGGVPIIFPQFGSGPIVNHGFARISAWAVVGSGEVEGGVFVTLALTDSHETRAIWPHKFRLDLTVTLTDTLATELWIENPDSHPWECTYLFHTYLNVADVTAVGVAGLKGCRYIDKVTGAESCIEGSETLLIDRFLDRVYRDTPGEILVTGITGDSALRLTTHNLQDTVVWNPWSDKTPSLSDLGSEDYRRFVCVEAGTVAHPVTVPPGERVVSAQELKVVDNGDD
jgi:glucose-6-phosphate 1-epimerase